MPGNRKFHKSRVTKITGQSRQRFFEEWAMNSNGLDIDTIKVVHSGFIKTIISDLRRYGVSFVPNFGDVTILYGGIRSSSSPGRLGSYTLTRGHRLRIRPQRALTDYVQAMAQALPEGEVLDPRFLVLGETDFFDKPTPDGCSGLGEEDLL